MIGKAATIGPAASLAQGRTSSSRPRGDTGQTDTPAAVSTALVPQTRLERENVPPTRAPRNDAAFIAHLIATAEHAPQTRHLRRASPQDAMAGYRATTQAGAVTSARLTSRLV